MSLRDRPRARLALWAVVLALFLAVYFAPLPDDLEFPSPGIISLVDVHGRPYARITVAEARTTEPLSLQEMGQWLPSVTVALEDHRFYSHFGLDVSSICGSAVRNIYHGRIISGASTISQQVVKLASRRQGRLFSSKIYEMCAAMRLERTWSKERILEEYLNRSHYGNRRVGPAAAARAYFGKKPSELSLSEAIYLAGLPQAPTRYNPWRNPKAAQIRYGRAVARLQKLGVVEDAEAARLLAHPPVIRVPEPPHPGPHFADALVADETPTPNETVIPTMLDLDLQPLADGLLRDWQTRLAGAGAKQMAVVVLDNETGGVSAMAGSPDYTAPDGMVNGALLERPCGAMLQPLIYAEALDRRLITAATPLPMHVSPDTSHAEARPPARGITNIRSGSPSSPSSSAPALSGSSAPEPVAIPAESPPGNLLLAREALRSGRYEPAVAVIRLAGGDACVNRLRLWGFHTLQPIARQEELRLEEGRSPVRLLDIATTCSGLARGGNRLPARYRQPARDEPTPVPERMISRGTALIVLDMMARSATHAPAAFGKDSPYLPCFSAVSPGNGDAWSVAITARHTIAVWVGNVDGDPISPDSARTAASEMAHHLAVQLLAQDGTLQPPVRLRSVVPAVVQLLDINAITGLAVPSTASPLTSPSVSAATTSAVKEYFLPGTAPASVLVPPPATAPGASGNSIYSRQSLDLALHGD
ncbi:MAG TPA: transglycosylase domain-containing protein [Candidatus Methylacidiphilales bacterium]|nr:transglycosylase domain-containing protein [Candidatus Methylacidiphilales bacterium]